MTDRIGYTKANIPNDLYERIMDRGHPRQPLVGVIEEILNTLEKYEKKDKE